MGVLLQECVDATVRFNSYENETLAAGIVHTIEGETLAIRPAEGQTLPTLLYGLPVQVSLHWSGREDVILGGVVYLSNNDILVLFDVKLLKQIEERNSFRGTTGAKGVLSRIASSIHQEMRKLDPADQKRVWVIDVGFQDVHFLSDLFVELGKEYLLRFQLNGTQCTLCMKIVRILVLLDNPMEHSHVFFDMRNKKEVGLRRCLYQIELSERKRKINMVN